MYLKQQTFTSSGSWTAPAGVTSVILMGQGGGGGAGAPFDDSGVYYFPGQSGGSTFLTTRVVPVTPGTTYTITIGAGGAGSTAGVVGMEGGAGGDTSFGSSHVWKGAFGGYANASILALGYFVLRNGYAPFKYTHPYAGSSRWSFPCTLYGDRGGGSNHTTAEGNIGCFRFVSAAWGNQGNNSGGGGGVPGNSSDAGLGGTGGNGANASTNGQPGNNAAATSYGAGGGSAGGYSASRPTIAAGGNGASGRLIVMWAE